VVPTYFNVNVILSTHFTRYNLVRTIFFGSNGYIKRCNTGSSLYIAKTSRGFQHIQSWCVQVGKCSSYLNKAAQYWFHNPGTRLRCIWHRFI